MLKLYALLFVAFGLCSLVASTCDFSHAICSSANLTCPSFVLIDNQSYGLTEIDVTVFGDATLNHGDIQGRAAIRNNFYTFNGVSVGDGIADTLVYDLIVGGNLVVSGDISIDNATKRIFVGGSSSVPAYITMVDHCSTDNESAGCLDSTFNSFSSYWSQFSSLLDNQPNNANISIAGGVATLTCSSSSNNYFIHISASDFNQISDYATSGCSSSANWIFTISGGDITFHGNAFQSSESYVVYNLVNVPQAQVNSTIDANIVAPSSNINVLAGVIDGVIIAGNITNIIQVNIPIYSNSSTISRATSAYCPYTNSGSSGGGSATAGATGAASGAATTSSASGAATTSSASGSGGLTSGVVPVGVTTGSVSGAASTTGVDNNPSGVNNNPSGVVGPSGVSTSDGSSTAISSFMFTAVALVVLV